MENDIEIPYTIYIEATPNPASMKFFANKVLIKEKANLCIESLSDLYYNGRVICTGQLSTNICKIEFPTKNNT